MSEQSRLDLEKLIHGVLDITAEEAIELADVLIEKGWTPPASSGVIRNSGPSKLYCVDCGISIVRRGSHWVAPSLEGSNIYYECGGETGAVHKPDPDALDLMYGDAQSRARASAEY